MVKMILHIGITQLVFKCVITATTPLDVVSSTTSIAQFNTYIRVMYAQAENKGCLNIKSLINCVGSNGCNELNLYTVNEVTEDINFEIGNCSRDKINLDSNFTNLFECTGQCCGNITNAFQTSNCALYCTPNYVCSINCINNPGNVLQHPIDAENSKSLSVVCIASENNSCNGMTIICPKYEYCNIQCLGNGACKTLNVNTNSVNNANLTCSSSTVFCYDARLHINDNKNDNSYASKNVTFGCTDGICQNVYIHNLTQLFDDKNINISIFIDSTTIEGEGNENKLSIIDTTFHVSVKLISINSASKLFSYNRIYYSTQKNVFVFKGNSVVQYNKISIPNQANDRLSLNCIADCKFISNDIFYDNNKINDNDMILKMDCNGIITNTNIDGNYSNYKINLGENCKLYDTDISATHSSLISINSYSEAGMYNSLVNGYNASEILLDFNENANGSFIDRSNSDYLSVSSSDSEKIKTQKI